MPSVSGSSYRRILAIAFTVIISTGAQADDAAFWPIRYEQWKTAFQKLNFLAFNVEASRNGASQPQIVMQWKESGDRVAYNYQEIPPSGKPGFNVVYCFDGTNSARTFGDNIMNVRKGPWITFPDWLQNLEFPTSVFEPILRVNPIKDNDAGNILTLSSSEIWEKFQKNVEILGPSTFENKKCNALRVKNGFAKLRSDRKFSYVLYVDPTAWLPLGWERFNESGKLMTRFEVLQQGKLENMSITMPTKVRVTHFAGDPPMASNAILSYWEFVFKDTSIVGNESDFSIDPTTVDSIFEEDQNIFIIIPK